MPDRVSNQNGERDTQQKADVACQRLLAAVSLIERSSPAVLRERVLAALDAHPDGHLVLLFHPFLLDAAPEALSVVADVLARAAEFECLRMDEAAG